MTDVPKISRPAKDALEQAGLTTLERGVVRCIPGRSYR